jgi:hypothetical protein
MRIKKDPNIIKQQNYGIATYLSIIALNFNSSYSLIKRYRVMGWIKKQGRTICCLQEMKLTAKENTGIK